MTAPQSASANADLAAISLVIAMLDRLYDTTLSLNGLFDSAALPLSVSVFDPHKRVKLESVNILRIRQWFRGRLLRSRKYVIHVDPIVIQNRLVVIGHFLKIEQIRPGLGKVLLIEFIRGDPLFYRIFCVGP